MVFLPRSTGGECRPRQRAGRALPPPRCLATDLPRFAGEENAVHRGFSERWGNARVPTTSMVSRFARHLLIGIADKAVADSGHRRCSKGPDEETLMSIRKHALAGAVAVTLGSVLLSAQTRDFQPVTDAMLQKPNAGEWLHWRGTEEAWGYSPLDQINRGNVGQLQLAWSWAMKPGSAEAAPLVHDGVMYIPQPGGGVQALDAVNGDFLWEYSRKYDSENMSDRPMRSIGLYGDKVFVNTPDAHIVGLNARTGAVVWDHTVADHKLGYEYTSGPIVAKGHVVAGMTGCTRYKNDVCFISAYYPDTSRELWRTSTIARPGEPGGDSWGDLPLTFRAGSDAWIPGSYDTGANLIYWSTAQAKPWARALRGTDGDALYTNSTRAPAPETAKITSYNQFRR